MRIRTGIATGLAAGLVIGLAASTPASASQPGKWIPAPPAMQKAVVKSINVQAKADGSAAHSPSCYQVLAWAGRSNYAVVNVRPGKNIGACGDPTAFGIRVYRQSGAKWVFVGGPSGSAGSACIYVKATSADKRFMRGSRVCR